MTVARSVADVLAKHVRFEVECIDRMYCNVYVPGLQYDVGMVAYVKRLLGMPVASTAPLAKISEHFTAEVHRFAREHAIPWVEFRKGRRKDDVMQEQLTRMEGAEGVVFIGRAQEKTWLFRTEKRRDSEGKTYPWIVKTTGVVNHYYFYCLDEDFGPFFIKFCSYFPYNAKLCLNGNHWAQRQAAKAGLRFVSMDNAFAEVEDAGALQAICDQLGADQIEALLWKWLQILPNPFSDHDRAAGYCCDLSILQAEFSLTQMLDRPSSGRVFFEQVIRDNLDTGRPDQVSLIFDRQVRRAGRHPTPGHFRTRVITDGVTPSLHIDYKHAQIKQYHKEGRALRTETTINDTGDFAIGKRLVNLSALREIGFPANRRLLRVQRLGHDPIAGIAMLDQITQPATTSGGTRVSGLRLGDPRSHALLNALEAFRLHWPKGFLNADFRHLVEQLRGLPDNGTSPGQTTYDLRRLREHGLIERVPRSHRYLVTDLGLHAARLLTRVQERVLPTGLAHLLDLNQTGSPLRAAGRAYEKAIDDITRQQGLAA